MAKSYPQVITPEIVAKNAHKSDTEIQTDIDETEEEVASLSKTMAAHLVIEEHALSQTERRMAGFHAGAERAMRDERLGFIAFLQRLQAARRAAAGDAEVGVQSFEAVAPVPESAR